LLRLTQAPQLRTLDVCDISFWDPNFSSGYSYLATEEAIQQLTEVIPRLLQQVPQLSVLTLPDFPFTDAAVQQTAAMQQLQQLELWNVDHVPVGNLQHVPSSITKLKLHGCGDKDRPILPPELPQLSGLLDLCCVQCAVPLKVLSCFAQLQLLELCGCRLLPSAALNVPDSDGLAPLLAALASLTSLKGLVLDHQPLDPVSTDLQLLSAWTAK
jgi:hypothetical protein